MIVRKIGVVSLGKITGAIYCVFGLVIGVIFGLFVLIGALVEGATGSGGRAIADMAGGLVGGLIVLLVMPIMYLVIGFIGGILTALLYNLFAARLGGVELELAER